MGLMVNLQRCVCVCVGGGGKGMRLRQAKKAALGYVSRK